jgi:hypothetical protein
MKEPLLPNEARKTLSALLSMGATIFFSNHAREEMADDAIESADVLNVLRAGLIHEPAEFENGSWRYRLHTTKFCVVVVLGDDQVRIVTAWRK